MSGVAHSHGVTGSDTVTNPCVPVTAAIFTTCGSPGTSSGVTDTLPLLSETAELCADASTGLAAHRPGTGHTPSHPSAVWYTETVAPCSA